MNEVFNWIQANYGFAMVIGAVLYTGFAYLPKPTQDKTKEVLLTFWRNYMMLRKFRKK